MVVALLPELLDPANTVLNLDRKRSLSLYFTHNHIRKSEPLFGIMP